ncbi:MAG: hypothetical protein A2Y76_02310 [Planctomycetes bacterium RBG_13_60_9]|nr:MAG: hypothetical protein A2Y76_02310 [Planctomycetes bacterium RBG_13_60_9]
MAQSAKENHVVFLISTGALAWLVPGGGHFILGEKRRAVIIFVAIVLTFLVGVYVGSVGVIDPVHARPWYFAQMMNSPLVMILGRVGATGNYRVYGRAGEIGQIYTSIAGLLNLLCVVNAIYMAHLRSVEKTEA